jgi:hypothetical protein
MRIAGMKIVLMLWLLTATFAPAVADAFTDRRITVGQKLFRTMLVANLNYKSHISSDASIYVDLLYQHDNEQAKKLASGLTLELTTINGVPVIVRPLSIAQYINHPKVSSIGAFITEKFDLNSLKKVIAKGQINQHILFSPFEGDVEKGVMAGLSVESRVRPYVNILALEQSNIKMKPFFIKVSKLYAPKL